MSSLSFEQATRKRPKSGFEFTVRFYCNLNVSSISHVLPPYFKDIANYDPIYFAVTNIRQRIVLESGFLKPYQLPQHQSTALHDTPWFSGLDFSKDIYAVFLNITQYEKHAVWCINEDNLGRYL